MTDYTEAFRLALEDYHNWLSKKKVDSHFVATLGELRGIFYNKLITQIRLIGESSYDLRHKLFPTDFNIIFEHPGSITKITLAIDTNYKYHTPSRGALLTLVKEALDSIETNVYYDAFEWKLEKIIKSLKT